MKDAGLRYYGEESLKLVTASQMRSIDSNTIKLGIPGIVLMENAACCVVKEILADYPDLTEVSVVIICGKGNNGGDGFAVARHLINLGAFVQTILVGKSSDLKGDALTNYEVLNNMGVPVIEIQTDSELSILKEYLDRAGLLVDALLGTGIQGTVRGIYKDVIDVMNDAKCPVIAVDVPSGLDSDTGCINGVCVKAYKTVTFGLPKIGLVTFPGAEYVGELIIGDIGIPDKVVQDESISTNLTTRRDLERIFKPRKRDAHKGDYGRAFIVGGSTGLTGAVVLTANAALRVGAGLVTVGVPATLHDIFEIKLTEAMSVPLSDYGDGTLDVGAVRKILEFAEDCNCVAIGPGLSKTRGTVQVIAEVLSKLECPCVVDADGLNCLAHNLDVLNQCEAPVILTPHPGEMSRLTELSISEIQENRLDISRQFAAEKKVILVLKGSRTVIASPDGTVYINPTGTPGMATGGSGDVLTGTIAGLIAQGVDAFVSALAGVYICGKAGEAVVSEKGEYGMVAGDIVERIPSVVKDFEKVKMHE